MARGQIYNAAAQESGSGGVRDRLAQTIFAQQPEFDRPGGRDIVAPPFIPRPPELDYPDFGSRVFDRPVVDQTPSGIVNDRFAPLGVAPLDPNFSDPNIPRGYGPNTFNPNGPGGYPPGVFTPTRGNVPLPPSRPSPVVSAPSRQAPVQQQRPQPAQPAPQPSLIDTFNPFQRIGPINPVPGPTSNFFTADLGSASGDYGSQFRGELPRNRTVGANYNGPLVDQF
jgi:hypothetical protein